MVKQKQHPENIHQENPTTLKELILFNDDVNTFDFVIETLIEVCEHEHEQAEQCAMIAHLKGKCMVKTGDYFELKPISVEMSFRGLTVSIE